MNGCKRAINELAEEKKRRFHLQVKSSSTLPFVVIIVVVVSAGIDGITSHPIYLNETVIFMLAILHKWVARVVYMPARRWLLSHLSPRQ
jgi:hypothetical protein